jgi:hypothetical protein
MRQERIEIDAHDVWKYQSTQTYAEGRSADVYYKDDGSLDEDLTYSNYYKSKRQGEEKKATISSSEATHVMDDNSSRKKKKKNKNKKDSNDGCLGKILKAPFKLLWWIIKLPFKLLLSMLF